MLSFMFAVLGSALFWVLFVVVGFFAGCLMLKFVTPDIYKNIIEKQNLGSWSQSFKYEAFVCIFLFWPIVLISIIIFYAVKFLMRGILWPLLCKAIKTTASIIPDIEIKQHKDT